MAQNKCQREGCQREGKQRDFTDTSQHCKWIYYLCDRCEALLQDTEIIAIAHKGTRSPLA